MAPEYTFALKMMIVSVTVFSDLFVVSHTDIVGC